MRGRGRRCKILNKGTRQKDEKGINSVLMIDGDNVKCVYSRTQGEKELSTDNRHARACDNVDMPNPTFLNNVTVWVVGQYGL